MLTSHDILLCPVEKRVVFAGGGIQGPLLELALAHSLALILLEDWREEVWSNGGWFLYLSLRYWASANVNVYRGLPIDVEVHWRERSIHLLSLSPILGIASPQLQCVLTCGRR